MDRAKRCSGVSRWRRADVVPVAEKPIAFPPSAPPLLPPVVKLLPFRVHPCLPRRLEVLGGPTNRREIAAIGHARSRLRVGASAIPRPKLMPCPEGRMPGLGILPSLEDISRQSGLPQLCGSDLSSVTGSWSGDVMGRCRLQIQGT
jgi:hypothetical protein